MGTITTRTGQFGEYFVGNNWLTNEQMQHNALYIYASFLSKGWHIATIAGVLGNLEHESTINSGTWEQLDDNYPCYVSYPWNANSPAGAGLVGWTPACDRLVPWSQTAGVHWSDLDFQLDELDHEFTYNLDGNNSAVWFGAATQGMTAYEFKTNARNMNAYDLAVAFLGGYERPYDPQNSVRGAAGEKWYLYLLENGDNAGMILPAFPTVPEATITSQYGWRTHPISGDYEFHYGLDIAYGGNPPIFAVMSGTVIVADYHSARGYYVVIKHAHDDKYSLYQHLDDYYVAVSDTVSRGQTIGTMGTTGDSTGDHLHIEIMTAYPPVYNPDTGDTIDPELYLQSYYIPPNSRYKMKPPKKYNFVVFTGRPVHIR